MVKKPERNEPCNCGSGKKYKNCCEGKTNPFFSSKMTTIFIVLAIAVGLLIAGLSLTGDGGQPDCPPGTVWSEAHQHCH